MGGRGAYSSASHYSSRQTGGMGGKSGAIDIATIKDKSLQGIENRIRRLQHEEAFAFDSKDNLIAGVSGGSQSVGIPNSWLSMDGATITHGHPTGIYNYGGTLSPADASVMAQTQWKEMRAAANGQGEFNYIMRRTPKSDNRGLQSRIIKDAGTIKTSIKTMYSDTYKNAVKNGKSKEAAAHEAAQKATGVMDAYWKKVLPKYGFEYVTPRKEYRYGR